MRSQVASFPQPLGVAKLTSKCSLVWQICEPLWAHENSSELKRYALSTERSRACNISHSQVHVQHKVQCVQTFYTLCIHFTWHCFAGASHFQRQTTLTAIAAKPTTSCSGMAVASSYSSTHRTLASLVNSKSCHVWTDCS